MDEIYHNPVKEATVCHSCQFLALYARVHAVFMFGVRVELSRIVYFGLMFGGWLVVNWVRFA